MRPSQPAIVADAVAALKLGERDRAATLLASELDKPSSPGDHWWPIAQLAGQIGEIDLAISAACRSASPASAERLLRYCGTLATYGRSEQAIAEIELAPSAIRKHPGVRQFLGMIASERGEFAKAERLYRAVLSDNPDALHIWLLLATIKTFVPGDPDIQVMEALTERAGNFDPDSRARLLYSVGKAFDDCGDPDRAFAYFAQGAAIRSRLERYDCRWSTEPVERTVNSFTAEAMSKLRPSRAGSQRALLVTGIPRSGTTLLQQLLIGHPDVADGAEVNLMRPALIPTRDFTFDGALAYQAQSDSTDPWGDVARNYNRFIDMRFNAAGMVVDKSLNQTILTGLQLHCLPDSKIVWVRRNPDDVALSCFQTYLSNIPWSWSLADIAAHLRMEDRLFDHWRTLFPDRILPVPYEGLVADPAKWMAAVQQFLGLSAHAYQPGSETAGANVQTASVRQIRSAVSGGAVGRAAAYRKHMAGFRAAYGS